VTLCIDQVGQAGRHGLCAVALDVLPPSSIHHDAYMLLVSNNPTTLQWDIRLAISTRRIAVMQ